MHLITNSISYFQIYLLFCRNFWAEVSNHSSGSIYQLQSWTRYSHRIYTEYDNSLSRCEGYNRHSWHSISQCSLQCTCTTVRQIYVSSTKSPCYLSGIVLSFWYCIVFLVLYYFSGIVFSFGLGACSYCGKYMDSCLPQPVEFYFCSLLTNLASTPTPTPCSPRF